MVATIRGLEAGGLRMEELIVNTVLPVALLLGLGFLAWRSRVVDLPLYEAKQLLELGTLVLSDFRDGAPRPEFPQTVEAYFANSGIKVDAANQLLEFMTNQGWIFLYEWSRIRRLLWQLPRVGLTQNGWERMVEKQPTIWIEGSPNTMINSGSGSQYSSGRDTVISSHGLTGSDLAELAAAIRSDMTTLFGESRDAAAIVVEVFEQASSTGEAADGCVRASMRWLKARVGKASSQLVARSIWEATAAVLNAKGIT